MKLSKIWVWDPRSEVRNLESRKKLFRILDPGVKRNRISDPDPQNCVKFRIFFTNSRETQKPVKNNVISYPSLKWNLQRTVEHFLEDWRNEAQECLVGANSPYKKRKSLEKVFTFVPVVNHWKKVVCQF
jgi:hypothetical protein